MAVIQRVSSFPIIHSNREFFYTTVKVSSSIFIAFIISKFLLKKKNVSVPLNIYLCENKAIASNLRVFCCSQSKYVE